MPTKTESHDTLAWRLARILLKLNQGEKLEPQALADEFQVNRRTIQRDLNERFDFLDLDRNEHGHYSLPSSRLGKLNLADVQNFAQLAGVHGLFPALSTDFLRNILDTRIEAVRVQGPQYETLGDKREVFHNLEQAILQRHIITFTYSKPEGLKIYTDAHPYKLVNHGGIWYLAARDAGQLKSFTLVKITELQVSSNYYQHDAQTEQRLAEEDDIWLNAHKQEVILKIAKEAASYFERRKLISNQVIVKKLEDGSLIVSTKIAHPNQILPTVRQWIPHIRVISPENMQTDLEADLMSYVQKKSKH